MASSGSFNTGNYDGRYLKFSWSIDSQSVEDNKTIINWSLVGAGTGEAGYYISGNFKVVIDGSTVYSSSTRIKLYDGTKVASGQKTIYHNSDGTRNFTASAQAGIYAVAVNCTGSKTFTLTAIPRATTPTVSNSSPDMGSAVTFTLDRASSDFTHTLKYSFEGKTGTIGTDLATSKSWTIPLDLASAIPSKTSATCTITCITYNGSDKIGEKTLSMTLKVPSSVKPTATLTVAEAVQEVADTFGAYVKGLSKLNIGVTGAGSYGSTISSYSINFNGSTYSTESLETVLLDSAGDVTITAAVKDSRGRTGSASVTITVEDYEKPYITTFTAVRCDADGTENEEGENAKIVIVGGITDLTGNTAEYLLHIIPEGATAVTAPEQITPDTPFAINETIILNDIDVDSTYHFAFEISDAFNMTIAEVSVGTAFTLIDYHSSGKGMSVGKVSEKEAFEVSLPSEFTKSVEFTDVVAFKNEVKFANSVSFVDTVTFKGGLTLSTVPNETDLDTLLTPNLYHLSSESTYINAPEENAEATLEILGNGNILQRWTYISKKTIRVYQRFYYSESWSEWILTVRRTDWIDLTIDDAYALYGDSVINQPQYRVNDNLVTIKGALSPKEAYTSSATKIPIASGIPSDLRPENAITFICQGSLLNTWCCIVGTDGTITMSRYGSANYETVPTTAWLTFHITYSI